MKLTSLATTGLELLRKRTCKRFFLDELYLSMQLLATINATVASKTLRLKTGTVFDATLIAAPGSRKKPEEARSVLRQEATRPFQCKALDKLWAWGNFSDYAEQMKASWLAKVEHTFRVMKYQSYSTRAMARVVQPFIG